jgi:hypothetical protein
MQSLAWRMPLQPGQVLHDLHLARKVSDDSCAPSCPIYTVEDASNEEERKQRPAQSFPIAEQLYLQCSAVCVHLSNVPHLLH